MKLNLHSLMVIFYQILIILVPLTWTSATSELFEFPKMLITYAVTIVITGLWLARMVNEKRAVYRRTAFELPILLFLVSQTFSTVFSIDVHTSLFGYYSRFNGGLLSFLCYGLLYFAAVSNFNRKDATTLIKTLMFAALVSALYAFPEHFGHSPSCQIITNTFNATCWVQDVQSRVFGTFGQPNWLAAYLVVILPLTIFSTVYAKTMQRRLLSGSLTILVLLTITFTKSQSGLGATAVALLTTFIIISFQMKKKLLILGLLPLFALVFITKQAAVMKTVHSLNNINPLYSTTADIVARDNLSRSGGTDSMIIRRVVWEGAWQLARKYPIFGTGVETFAYAYYQTRPVEHNLISEWDFLYNKAHNEFLNFAATTGFVGLGTYVAFLVSFIYWCTRRLKSSPSCPEIGALLSGFIALLVSNFFGFSTVPVNILLFLFPALALLLTAPDPAPQSATKSNNTITAAGTPAQTVGHIVIAGAAFLLLLAVNRALSADIAYARGKSAKDSRNFQTAILELQKAVKAIPDEPLYTDELSLTASEIASSLSAAGQTAQASQAAAIAIELSNRTVGLNRVHLNFYKTRTKAFINLSQIDPGYAVQAGVTLDAAIHLAPTDAKLWYNRAVLTKQLGYNEEAVGIFEKTIALKPDYELARLHYGQLLEELNQPDKAAAQYQYSLTHINPNSPQIQAALAAVSTKSAIVTNK